MTKGKGLFMRIDKGKLDLIRAKQAKTLDDLPVSKSVLIRINKGQDVHVLTIGKIAIALNCELEDLILNEEE